MNNPSHKQKKSKDDAPQWYIDAYLEALEIGTAVMLMDSNQKVEHLPKARYQELIEALKHQQKQKH